MVEDPSLLWGVVESLAWLGGAVLAVAGILKLRRPATAIQFARQLRTPAPAVVIRTIAPLELVVGILAVSLGSAPLLIAAAVLYACFIGTLVVHRLTTGQETVSCGCFGSSSKILVAPHVAALGVALAATVASTVRPHPSLVDVARSLAIPQALLLFVLLALALALLVGAAANGTGASAATVDGVRSFRLTDPPPLSAPVLEVLSVPSNAAANTEER